MKNSILKLVIIMLFSGVMNALFAQNIELRKAIDKKIITATVEGNDESPHYIKPLEITLKNLTQGEVIIEIPNGQQFVSDDPGLQDIMLVKEELITLAPGATVTKALNGMCIQQAKSAPASGYSYRPGPIAEGELAELAKEIEKRSNFNTLGQYAVWAITDKDDLNSIAGFDQQESDYMRGFVAGLLNVPVPDFDPNDYRHNYNDDGLIKRAAKGKFKFTFSEASSVTIAMFDEEGIVVRELYNNPNESPGTHDLEFKFDIEVYKNKAYFVRMIVDGEIKIDMKMEPRRS